MAMAPSRRILLTAGFGIALVAGGCGDGGGGSSGGGSGGGTGGGLASIAANFGTIFAAAFNTGRNGTPINPVQGNAGALNPTGTPINIP